LFVTGNTELESHTELLTEEREFFKPHSVLGLFTSVSTNDSLYDRNVLKTSTMFVSVLNSDLLCLLLRDRYSSKSLHLHF